MDKKKSIRDKLWLKKASKIKSKVPKLRKNFKYLKQ